MKIITLWGFKGMVCITWRKKANYYFLKTTKKKIAKQNDNFLLNPFFRVQKELWTESLALHLSAESPSGPFIMLEICVLFCWLHYNRSHSLSFLGVFSILEWRICFSEYLFYLLLFFSLFFIAFFFPCLAPFELLWEIFLLPKLVASVIEIM